jgi:hypothetical protein
MGFISVAKLFRSAIRAFRRSFLWPGRASPGPSAFLWASQEISHRVLVASRASPTYPKVPKLPGGPASASAVPIRSVSPTATSCPPRSIAPGVTA